MDLTLSRTERHSEVALVDERTADGIRQIYEDGTPENTKLAYVRDMAYVKAWCEARNVGPAVPMTSHAALLFIVDHVKGLPDEVDAELVASGAKRDFGPHSISTIRRRVAVISVFHNLAKVPSPFDARELKDLLARSRKAAIKNGWRPRKKLAAYRDVLEKMLASCADDPAGVRDRAILLFGFSTGGRRRSEITDAIVERLTPMGESFVYDLGITKTTQNGEASSKPVKGRAAEALRRWLELSGVKHGRIFRAVDRMGRIGEPLKPKAVWKIVRKRARLAGLDPQDFGGHSLRSGFMTECGIQGIALADAMALSEHRTTQIAIGYYQVGEGLRNRGGDLVG